VRALFKPALGGITGRSENVNLRCVQRTDSLLFFILRKFMHLGYPYCSIEITGFGWRFCLTGKDRMQD
jgi:hypothetical protein